MGWLWHQLDHMQIVCTSLQTDNHALTNHSFFTGRMPFLPPNQQLHSTEGTLCCKIKENRLSLFKDQTLRYTKSYRLVEVFGKWGQSNSCAIFGPTFTVKCSCCFTLFIWLCIVYDFPMFWLDVMWYYRNSRILFHLQLIINVVHCLSAL